MIKMCNKCFEQEYKWFDTNKEWKAFDLILTQKLGAGNLVDNGYKRIGRDEFEYFYKCKNCNQEWKLREPIGEIEGYFLKTL